MILCSQSSRLCVGFTLYQKNRFSRSIDEKRYSRSIDAIRGPVSAQPKEHAFSVCEARAPQCSGLALGPQDDVRDAHQLRSGEDNQRPQIGGVFSRRDQDCLRI